MTNPVSLLAQHGEELARTKKIATGLLVVMACVFLAARMLQSRFAWLSFVAAFAEASMVGALADWFAVTALFRSPLGLPIPHTAIIARNKDRIGSSIANFLENNFLTPEVIAAELRAIDFAALAGTWLCEPNNRRSVGKRITHSLPWLVDLIDEHEGARFLNARIASLLTDAKLGPLAAEMLVALVVENRHHQLFDLMLQFARHTLENNKPLIRQKIHERSPRWIPQSVDERFFVNLLEEVEAFLEQMSLPESEWRTRFQEAIDELIEKLRSSPEYEAVITRSTLQALDHPLFAQTCVRVWRDTRAKLLADLEAEESQCARQIDRGLSAFAEVLTSNGSVAVALNGWLRTVTTGFLVARRSLIASLVRRVIQSWDGETVSRKFELYIGRDLQYIRINGTIVGGLAGLLLHSVSLALT